METKEDQFSVTSLNPMLRVDKTCTVIYSNDAGKTLLNEWGVRVGEKLPSNIGNLVQRVISRNNPEKMEFIVEKSVYLTVFHPLYEEKCVCISGFDVSYQNGFGEKVQESGDKSFSKCDTLLEALRECEEEYLNLIETTNEGIFLTSVEAILTYANLRTAEKALQESEIRFRTLAENSPDIITRFDRQHSHIYANPAAVESYGISLDEIIGKTQGELGRDSKKAKFWQKNLEIAFVTGTIETLEYNYISPQGKKYYFNTKIVPEFADGKIISVLAISRDITDIREAEAKLKEMLENLEKLIEKRTTELEKAYNSLKESEKGLSEAQKMAHIGNWEYDIATDHAYWSDELYRIFDRDLHEQAPTCNEYLFYVHPDERDYVANVFKKGMTGKAYSIDHRIVLENGEERTVHIQSEFIYNDENIPVRIKGIVQDISARKKAEEKIRNLASIVESSSDAIITKSLDNIITSWNKGAEQIYGYSAAEVLGKPVSILIPSHSDEERKRLTEMIKHRDRIHYYETSGLRKDGKILDISLNLSPIVDDSGKLTAISVIARDITERKRVEEKLRESEEKYRNIVETANEGITLTSPEGLITYFNKKMADMLGYTFEEGIGRPIFNFLCEKSIDIVKLNMEKRLKGIDNSYELQLKRKDGSLIWVHINAKSLSGKNGEFIGALTMLTDITESKRAENALKENESRFRNLFEVITSGVAIIDVIDHGRDFIFKDMNPACERIFHIQREDIIGKSLYKIFPCANKMGLEAAFRWVWLAGQQEFIPPVFYEYRNITLWLTINIFRLPSGELVVVFEDITERKQAYEEREQLLDYIQQEKDRLFALVNSITDEVWFTDTKKNFTLVNPSALNKFNIKDENKVKMDKLVVSLEVYKPDGRVCAK